MIAAYDARALVRSHPCVHHLNSSEGGCRCVDLVVRWSARGWVSKRTSRTCFALPQTPLHGTCSPTFGKDAGNLRRRRLRTGAQATPAGGAEDPIHVTVPSVTSARCTRQLRRWQTTRRRWWWQRVARSGGTVPRSPTASASPAMIRPGTVNHPPRVPALVARCRESAVAATRA